MLAFLVLACPSVRAQLPSTPHIGYVYPAGGRQGTTFQVKVGGQLLDGVTNAYVSGTGVQAVVVDFAKPLTPQQANALRERMRELQAKRQGKDLGSTNASWTTVDAKLLAEIRQKLAAFQRRPPNPAIAETATLRITVAPDAEPGDRELRLRARLGLSNPMVFCVGQLPEFRKPDRELNAGAARFRPARNPEEQHSTPATETVITLPAVVNGQILPGGVDWYRFPARKGQRLVIAVSARSLIPYLADAVPGWFQAALTLYDAKGHELAYADHYQFHPDPVLYYEVSRDGDYLVQIRDSIYRGREDFVYRIAIGELPFLTSVFPLGGPVDSPMTLELAGWNLPTNRLTVARPSSAELRTLVPLQRGETRDGRDSGCASSATLFVSVPSDNRSSNPLPFALGELPECLEKEPNNTRDTAQPVALPIVINGRIAEPGDQDLFRFEGRGGDEFVAEIYARRLESPLDSVLELTDASGHRLAYNDDHDDKGSGLNTHHADSYLRFSLPTNGTYLVRLADAQGQGGTAYAYRLRLSPPVPDFELRVVPSSITARAGLSVPITVYVLRKDGFAGEVELALKDAPAGMTLSGSHISAAADEARLTLQAPARVGPTLFKLSLEGRAVVNGRQLRRAAVPADDMMQAFAYRHLVPAREWDLAVLSGPRRAPASALRILETTPLQIPAGGATHIRLGSPGPALAGRVHLELSQPPDGISLGRVTSTARGLDVIVASDAAKVKPGFKGNLIIDVFPERPAGGAPKGKAQTNNRRFALGSLPAIPFEIVAR